MSRQTLFPLREEPSGLRYEPGFISAGEQDELIAHVKHINLQPFQFGAFEGKRRVAWFGWRYDYSDRQLKPAADIPAWLGVCTADQQGEPRAVSGGPHFLGTP